MTCIAKSMARRPSICFNRPARYLFRQQS